jgi:acyl-CoA hydrolase
MKFYSRKLIKPDALNANNTLFGGALLHWIDEEAGIYAMTKLNTQKVVTKFISEINFVSSARQGDVIEIGLKFLSIGTTSISFKCEVRNVFTKKTIIEIDKIVFVKVDDEGLPTPHDVTLKDIEENSIVV